MRNRLTHGLGGRGHWLDMLGGGARKVNEAIGLRSTPKRNAGVKSPFHSLTRIVTNVAVSGIACSHGSAESTFAFIASEPLIPNLPARPVSRSSPAFADFSDNRGDNGCGMSRMTKLE